MIYQCQHCRGYYGTEEEAPELVPLPIKTIVRYVDCDIWQCPHCYYRQDGRDIAPFLGISGGNTVRLITLEQYKSEEYAFHLLIRRFRDDNY